MFQNPNFFKGKYGTKIEFSEEVGEFKLKNLLWEGYGYFLEQHIINFVINILVLLYCSLCTVYAQVNHIAMDIMRCEYWIYIFSKWLCFNSGTKRPSKR